MFQPQYTTELSVVKPKRTRKSECPAAYGVTSYETLCQEISLRLTFGLVQTVCHADPSQACTVARSYWLCSTPSQRLKPSCTFDTCEQSYTGEVAVMPVERLFS